ncbi:hypothetical protein Tco_0693477 [Tanacetum coccineum]
MIVTKFDIEKFDRKNDFALWQVRMKALLEQQGFQRIDLVFGQSEHIDEFHKLVETLLYGRDIEARRRARDTLILGNSEDGEERVMVVTGCMVRRRSGQKGICEKGSYSAWSQSKEEAADSGIQFGADGEFHVRGDRGFYREDVVGQDQGYKGFTGGVYDRCVTNPTSMLIVNH